MELDGGEKAEDGQAGGHLNGAAEGGVGQPGDVAGEGVEFGVGDGLDGRPLAGRGGRAADVLSATEAVGDAVVRESHRF